MQNEKSKRPTDNDNSIVQDTVKSWVADRYKPHGIVLMPPMTPQMREFPHLSARDRTQILTRSPEQEAHQMVTNRCIVAKE